MRQVQQSDDVFFNQPCPVCGRSLRVRVQLLGRRVYCQHCGGGFTAIDESLRGPSASDRADDLIARASRVLERTAIDGADESGFSG